MGPPEAAWSHASPDFFQEDDAPATLAWPGLQHPDVMCETEVTPSRRECGALAAAEEDDEEQARQEQLMTTLRCMGFDEEPSQQAAQRAGGNLNAAVEAALRSRCPETGS